MSLKFKIKKRFIRAFLRVSKIKTKSNQVWVYTFGLLVN